MIINLLSYLIIEEYIRKFEDDDDDYKYEEVPVDDFYEDEVEENFELAINKLQEDTKDKLNVIFLSLNKTYFKYYIFFFCLFVC